MEYISKEVAIEALKGLPTWWGDGGGWYGHAQPPMVALLDPLDAVNAIDNIPAADVREVVHGRWINQRADSEMCSACGVRFYISALFAVGGNDEPNYCPNCGADMRCCPDRDTEKAQYCNGYPCSKCGK